MPREFEIRREVELPATAEQVWAAIATGDGTASWMFPTGEGAPSRVGEVWAGHTVTMFDPPRHIAVRADGPDGVFNALEYIIEARDGGTALLRYVHTLGQYLQYFQGRTVTYVTAEGPAASVTTGAFGVLRRELGLTASGGIG